jgi:hypothetical protein
MYTTAIKKAKQVHWNEFLSNANEQTSWHAKRYRDPPPPASLPSFADAYTPSQLATALANSFFPPTITLIHNINLLPPILPFEPISQSEITLTLSKVKLNSCPGPDSNPYKVWKAIHYLYPSLLPYIITACLSNGIHPSALKHAHGFVLPKKNKADYITPRSFRVIVLLNTFSKLIERTVQLHRSLICRPLNLISLHQIRALPGSSTADTTTCLMHEVDIIQRTGHHASIPFFDIRGGFDHVKHYILRDRLRSHNTPEYITQWIQSFFLNRTITLLFSGSLDLPIPIDIGVPQGSAISPFLFNIYAVPIHSAI